MGGEPWGNFVPYQADIEKALRDLQDDVFARRAFRPTGPIGPRDLFDLLDQTAFFDPETTDEERELDFKYGFEPLRAPLRRLGLAGLRAWLLAIGAKWYPDTREEFEVLCCFDSDGSASALDFVGLSEERTPGYVAPLPAADRVRYFGTERPTRAQLEAHLAAAPHPQGDDLYGGIGRYEAVYFVLYDGDAPSEIYFAGYSPD